MADNPNSHTRNPTFRHHEILDSRVEGIEYTKQGIDSIREELVALRCNTEDVHVAMTLTHAIAIMAQAMDQATEFPRQHPTDPDNQE